MTLKEFREHKYLSTAWAKELRTNGLLQRVIETLGDNHPEKLALVGDNNNDISPTRAAIELGVARGYSQYADRLQLLAIPLRRERKDIGETTYQPATTNEKETEEAYQP